ncbi:MAG: hypothetical protein OIF47_16910 [Marinibacterium sp.]|nr:hypothetical protein [Marinibacterium sp.]
MRFPRYTTQWIYAITCAIILVALWVGLRQGNIGAAFDEGELGTYASVLILLLTGGTSFALYRARRGGSALALSDDRRIWQVCGVGFIFLALDDAFRIHENLDKLIHRVAGLQETGLSDRIDDVLILIYGLIGFAILARARREIARSRGFLIFMIDGFALMVVQFCIDVATNSNDLLIWIGIPAGQHDIILSVAMAAEESVKLLAGATLLAGFVHAYRELALHHAVPRSGRPLPKG